MKLIRKVTSSSMLRETRSVTGVQLLTQAQMKMMPKLNGNVRLQICSDMAKFRDSNMEAELLLLLGVLPPVTQQLASLSIIPDRHMALVLLSGQLFPAITTRPDCPMYWRRTSEVEQAPVKSVVPVAIDVH
jgi:hypothetical protein